jgi:exopolysaccharide biosynthesis polyprenyl glycosylphosphotransferase
MPRGRREFLIQINQLTDALLIAVVFWVAHAVREQLAFLFPWTWVPVSPFRYYKWLYLIILPLYPFLLDISGYYTRPAQVRVSQILWQLVKGSAICVLAVVAAMYFLQMSYVSRGVVILFGGMSVVALFIKDRLTEYYFRRHAILGEKAKSVVLVGNAEKNAEFQQLIEGNPVWNLAVVRQLEPTAESLAKLPDILHAQPIACVIFNVSQAAFADVEKAILTCEVEGVEAWLVADFVRTSIARASIDVFHGKPLLVFRTAPDISWMLVAKRLMDVVGAAIGLLILGPLVMLPSAIAIKISSRGPVFFRQRRSGLHGRQFTMYKFRSMVTNAEMLRAELEAFNEMGGPVFKIADDPRVTKVGRFLRKTSIDEFPQLWNVLVGDMSLVGPRPPIPSEVDKYDPWHRRRLSMKPGLTCLWQIGGRNNVPFEQWMKLDLEYIDNWSLWLDIKIIARTIPVVLSGLGAR